MEQNNGLQWAESTGKCSKNRGRQAQEEGFFFLLQARNPQKTNNFCTADACNLAHSHFLVESASPCTDRA